MYEMRDSTRKNMCGGKEKIIVEDIISKEEN